MGMGMRWVVVEVVDEVGELRVCLGRVGIFKCVFLEQGVGHVLLL